MARAPAARSGKLRLHLENSSKKPGEKQYTLERYLAVAKKHRAAARRLEVSVGHDGDISDRELAKIDFMLGVPPDRARLKTAAKRLQWLHCTMAGVDALLPLDWLPPQAQFTNNVGVHGHKAREFVRMAITLLHTRLPQMLANQQKQRWQQIFSPALAGRTGVVVGLGDVGGGAAQAARDLGLKVIGVRRSGKASPLADRTVKLSQLDRVLPLADVVVLAAPNTAETRNLLNERRIGLLPKGCGIVNIGRATLLDHAALCTRLRKGTLCGAVLDVMPSEPLPANSPFWQVPNLIITPHISCDDSDYAALTLERWFLNVERLLAGQPLHNRVNPQRGY